MTKQTEEVAPTGFWRPASVMATTAISTTTVVASTLGVYVLGILAPLLNRDLGISLTDIGSLTAAMFIAAGLLSVPSGWLADRVKVSTLATIQMLVSGLSIGLFAVVGGFVGLFLLSILIGVLSAVHGPLGNRLVTEYVERVHFKYVMGWKSLGPQIGSFATGVLIAPMLTIFPWRTVVIVAGLMIVVATIPLFLAMRVRDKDSKLAPEDRRSPGKGGGWQKPPPVVLWLMAYSLFSSGAVVTIGAYLPTFAVEDLGMGLAAAGIAGGVVAISSLLGRVFWIRIVTDNNATTVMTIAGLASALAMILLAMTPVLGTTMFWISAALVGATALGTSPLSQIVLIRSCPPSYIGRASALTGVPVYLGFTVQPLIVGWIGSNFGMGAAWLVVSVGTTLAATVIFAYGVWLRRTAASAIAADSRMV